LGHRGKEGRIVVEVQRRGNGGKEGLVELSERLRTKSFTLPSLALTGRSPFLDPDDQRCSVM
jgi:hypothetical protein